ncbi:MAG: hypothetical protein K6T90_06015 [Leptolyngbyaceae cyanobacterium HOT.MB2.61]|nr:hypothetical protein [Leptolyngbyaceae cyanobacterium HOT.MB2.61]
MALPKLPGNLLVRFLAVALAIALACLWVLLSARPALAFCFGNNPLLPNFEENLKSKMV